MPVRFSKNLRLLAHCVGNPEEFLDRRYMFVEKDAGLDSIAADVAELKRLVAEYSRASGKKRKELVESVRKHVSVGYVNYSEFGSFVNACDSNEDEVVSDPELLERILDLYVKNRDVSYPDPRETEFSKRWIQAMLDKGSSRKKGKLGERKIWRTLEHLGYVQAKTLSDFTKERFCFADFERDGEFSMKNVNAFFGTKFGESTQNKMLDVLIRSGDDFYFMEAKHMNTAWGGQNKQVLELIEMLGESLEAPAHHVVGYLDWLYFNRLFPNEIPESARRSPESMLGFFQQYFDRISETGLTPSYRDSWGSDYLVKLEHQRRDVVNALAANPKNFFINTSGLEALFRKREP